MQELEVARAQEGEISVTKKKKAEVFGDLAAQFAAGWDDDEIPTMESLGLGNGEKVVGKAVYVYILGSEIGYKIGVSNNPYRREKTSTMSPVNIELLFYANLGMQAFKVDRAMKRFYGRKNLRREWFRLTKEDVNWIRNYFGDRIEYPPEKTAKAKREIYIEDRTIRTERGAIIPKGYPYHLLVGSPCDCAPADCWPEDRRPQGWNPEEFMEWMAIARRIDFDEFKKPREEPKSMGELMDRRREEWQEIERRRWRKKDILDKEPSRFLKRKKRA